MNNKTTKTSYLYVKDARIIVPVEFSEACKTVAAPRTIDTLQKIIKFAHLRPAAIKLYMYKDDVFYTYVTLKTPKGCFDMNFSFKDALELKSYFEMPVYVSESVLNQCGIFITRDLIEQALSAT